MIKFEKITANGTTLRDTFLKEVQEKANSINGRVINISIKEIKYTVCTDSVAIIWYEEEEKNITKTNNEKDQLMNICGELKSFSDYIYEEIDYIKYLCDQHHIDHDAFMLIEKKDLDEFGLSALEAKKKTCITQRCWFDKQCVLGTPGTLYCYDFEQKCLVPLIENKASEEDEGAMYY